MAVNISDVLQNLNTRSQNPSLSSDLSINLGGITTNPASKIAQALRDKTLSLYQFPSDIPPHHFTIVQGSATGITSPIGTNASSIGNFTAAYKLPMPTVITNRHTVRYDHNFNWMAATAKLLGAGGILEAVNPLIRGLGYSLNTFKALTLSTPEFRSFTLEWRLFPKTLQESRNIQRLVVALQTGMTPATSGEGVNLVFQFPAVFLPFFTTGLSSNEGSRYLFKFKPCVLDKIEVNYQGDQPVPAFYKNADDQAIPEGIVLRTSWIELEVWSQQNFRNSTDSDGLYNNDPFSGFNR